MVLGASHCVAQAVIQADKMKLAQNPGQPDCPFYMRTGKLRTSVSDEVARCAAWDV